MLFGILQAAKMPCVPCVCASEEARSSGTVIIFPYFSSSFSSSSGNFSEAVSEAMTKLISAFSIAASSTSLTPSSGNRPYSLRYFLFEAIFLKSFILSFSFEAINCRNALFLPFSCIKMRFVHSFLKIIKIAKSQKQKIHF